MAPPKPKPTTKYSYTIKGKKVNCFASTAGGQSVLGLWEAGELSDFHDADLAQATREINAILTKVQKSTRDRKKVLGFIQFQNRHLLVWSEYGAVGPDADDAAIIKALKLKAR